MSTAVARPAHGGFRQSGSGKPDPEDADRMRDANGYLVQEREKEEEERGGEAAAAGREEEALSEASSIGAASSDSSSIGENSASDKEGSDGEEEEVEGKAQGLGMMGLATLQSLDDALPTKRGLSNFYAGKSKSFTSLAEAAATAAAKEIAKPENPFNKRRRVLRAWSRRRASCSALATAYLPPLLAPDHAVVEEEDEEGADDEDEDEGQHGRGGLRGRRPPTFPSPRLSAHATAGQMARAGSFRSPRSFSMTDLHSAEYE
ncbi:hypothetical protein Zm00014a_019189 [Zea mays]|uniref:Oligopeptide transporter-like protein n=2 Tax=Zea mays TaxID=4577 RepID=A0A3L6EYU2_MAIZE|nr:hypothetical protein Zm00014a_019189 [Zea mays]PWZ26223.1 hypothetical protein Zm00014a_019189 [Zea mays]PWZ26224.1 hypothetical protein Zm00014a_019189 [Zea mays]